MLPCVQRPAVNGDDEVKVFCQKMLPQLLVLAAVIFDLTSSSCVSFDAVCSGPHGEPGDCCQGLYCHRPSPDWSYGRCYEPVKVCGRFGTFILPFLCLLFDLFIHPKQTTSVKEIMGHRDPAVIAFSIVTKRIQRGPRDDATVYGGS